MNEPIKRYEADRDGDPFEYPDGKFVLYDDHKVLQKDLDALRELARLIPDEQWKDIAYLLDVKYAVGGFQPLKGIRELLLK